MLDRFLLVQRTCGAFALLLLIFCSIVSIARAESDEEHWAKVNPFGMPPAMLLPC